MRRIRIPGIVDLVRVDDPNLITTISEHEHLDRNFAGPGPVLNRWIARRIRRTLQVGGIPLPSVAPRMDARRAESQARLEADLDQVLAAGPPAPDNIAALAAYVRGESGEETLGPAAQEAVGRLFAQNYRADRETWRAACILDAAPRNMNPFRALAWALTNAVARSREILARAVVNDPAGVHATGIAIHTLVRSLKAMRALWQEPGTRNRISADVAVSRSLRAPETVIRRWTRRASTRLGEMPEGALTMFELEPARHRHPGRDIVFMAESWSHCPAARWTAELLRAVWTRAMVDGDAP
jgi:hypothetical protein